MREQRQGRDHIHVVIVTTDLGEAALNFTISGTGHNDL